MASLGQELRRERELRAVTLKEIANLTKISLKYLQALEEDRLDILPGPFFIKGVIRAFAKAIGTDENYFLNKYHADELLHTYAVDRERKKSEPGLDTPIRSHSRLYAVVAVCILAVGIFLYIILLKPHHGGRSASSRLQSPRQQIQTAVTTPPRLLEAVIQAQKTPLKLELSFRAASWIQVYADGELKIDGIKQAGEKTSCEAQKELLIHTGNAGGFTLTINGKPGKPLGGPGIVLTDIKITPDNYVEFLVPPDKAKEASAK